MKKHKQKGEEGEMSGIKYSSSNPIGENANFSEMTESTNINLFTT